MNHFVKGNIAASGHLSRRGFAVTTLTAGFALAVQPIAATALTTDATGLTTGEAQVAVSGGAIPAFFARPAGQTNPPVILVIHEIFGVHEWIKDICRRFAKAGYFAVAPYLYSRAGDAAQYTDIKKLVADIVLKTSDDTVLADLDATNAWAAAQGGDASKIGVTGFCWGGRATWLYAAHNPKVKAGVAWYGPLVKGATDPRPVHPIDVADKIKGRVLGMYAGEDSGIPLDSVEKMRAALRAAGDKQSDILVYNGAKHGFLADYRPAFNPAAAGAAWARALAWFKERGVS